MKSDKRLLFDFLTQAGIEYKVSEVPEEYRGRWRDRASVLQVIVEAGYVGFYTEYVFDQDGKLLEHGAYE